MTSAAVKKVCRIRSLSEGEPGLQLRDAGRARAVDLAKIGRLDVGLDRRVVDPVERVQDVGPELDAPRTADADGLADRQIEVLEAGGAELADADVPGADRLPRQRVERQHLERRRIEVLHVVVIDVAAAVDVDVRDVDDIRAAAGLRRRLRDDERLAGAEPEDPGYLPAGEDLADER